MAIANAKGTKPLSDEEQEKLEGEGRQEEEAMAAFMIKNGKPKKV